MYGNLIVPNGQGLCYFYWANALILLGLTGLNGLRSLSKKLVIYDLSNGGETIRQLVRKNREHHRYDIKGLSAISSNYFFTVFNKEYPDIKWVNIEKDKIYDFFRSYTASLDMIIADMPKQIPASDGTDGNNPEPTYKIDEKKLTTILKFANRTLHSSQHLITRMTYPDCLYDTGNNIVASEWPKINKLIKDHHFSLDCVISVPKNYLNISEMKSFDYTGQLLILKKTQNTKEYKLISLNNNCNDYQKVIQEIVRDLKTGLNSSSCLYSISKEIPFDGNFDLTLQKQKISDINRSKKKKGFNYYKGKTLIKRIDAYDIEDDDGFEDESQSLYIPMTSNLLKSNHVYFSWDFIYPGIIEDNPVYGDFKLESLPWYQYIMTQITIPGTKSKECPIKDTDHIDCNSRAENIIPFDDDKLDVLLHNNDFFESNGIDATDDLVSKDGQVVQHIFHEQYGSNITTTEILKRQLVYANFKELILDSDIINMSYFQLLIWHTEYGRNIFAKWCDDSKKTNPLKAFEELDIYLPSLRSQIQFVQEYHWLESQEIQAKMKRRHLLEYIGNSSRTPFAEKENAYISQNTISQLDTMPQPLASILYIGDCETDLMKKDRNFINLFEATAIFHTTILLSILEQQKTRQKLQDILKNFFDTNLSPKNRKYNFMFGFWTNILLNLKPDLDIFPFLKERNKALIDFLHSNARPSRNEKSHAGRFSDIQDELNLKYDHGLSEQLKSLLMDIYDSFLLIKGRFKLSKKDDSTNELYCYKAMGPHPRLRMLKLEVPATCTFDDDAFYLISLDNRCDPIKILPFISSDKLCKNDRELLSIKYIASIRYIKKDKDDVRFTHIEWKSYDCGDIINPTTSIKPNEAYPSDYATRNIINWLNKYAPSQKDSAKKTF